MNYAKRSSKKDQLMIFTTVIGGLFSNFAKPKSHFINNLLQKGNLNLGISENIAPVDFFKLTIRIFLSEIDAEIMPSEYGEHFPALRVNGKKLFEEKTPYPYIIQKTGHLWADPQSYVNIYFYDESYTKIRHEPIRFFTFQ